MFNAYRVDFMNPDKHSDKVTNYDYKLSYVSKEWGSPEAQTNLITVPGSSIPLDYTEAVTGDVSYNPIESVIHFKVERILPENLAFFKSTLLNKFQGKRIHISFVDDESYYWNARVNVTFGTHNANLSLDVDFNLSCDPYKYTMDDALGGWLWDSFDFENDVINELKYLDVPGEATYELYTNARVGVPTIWNHNGIDMTVTFKGKTYELANGANKMYDLALDVGANTFIFAGNGVVSIQYRGGKL